MPCAVFLRSKEARAAAPSLQEDKPNLEKKGKEKERKEKTTPFGGNLMRSQVLPGRPAIKPNLHIHVIWYFTVWGVEPVVAKKFSLKSLSLRRPYQLTLRMNKSGLSCYLFSAVSNNIFRQQKSTAAFNIWSAAANRNESSERAREGFGMGPRGPQGKVEGWCVVRTSDTSALMASNPSAAHQARPHCMRLLCAVEKLKHPPNVETHFYCHQVFLSSEFHRGMDVSVKIWTFWD